MERLFALQSNLELLLSLDWITADHNLIEEAFLSTPCTSPAHREPCDSNAGIELPIAEQSLSRLASDPGP